MADGKLTFLRPHDGTGRLVFGDVGDVVVTPPVTIAVDTDLPGMGACALSIGPALRVDADLPGLGACTLVWDSNTSRPTVGQTAHHYQQAQPARTGLHDAYQQAQALPTGLQSRYQQAHPLQAPTIAAWDDAAHTRATTGLRYQQAQPAHHLGLRSAWQTAQSHRVGSAMRYQEAWPLQVLGSARFQQALGLRLGGLHRYQEALRSGRSFSARFQRAQPWRVDHRVRYQEAWPPRPGLSVLIPLEPPGPPPCYTPNGHLVFTAAHDGTGHLVFVCERATPPEPGGTVVVPIKEVYLVINSAILIRVDGGVAIPTLSMSMSLDVDSWTWSLSASVPGYALPDIEPVSGVPVDVQATINGVPYRFVVESIARERTFGRNDLRIGGRGRAAVLDAPYAPVMAFRNTFARTAEQIMNDILTDNGVPLGWTVDWNPDDWLVPAGVFNHQGSYISAMNQVAGSIAAYLQPHNTDETLRVLSRYPVAPWDWGDVTPDYELPSAVVTRESIEWRDKARYNRVYVMGQQVGVNGRVTRAGTAGDYLAPTIVDPLITQAVAARQRGIAVLSDTGRIATVGLRLPVLAETGVIAPGSFVKYVDGGIERIGLTRSVSVEVDLPSIWQTLGVETHVEPV